MRPARTWSFPTLSGNLIRSISNSSKRSPGEPSSTAGQCVSEHNFKCAEGPFCERIFLHKFRHTFATQHLRDGIDIVTLKDWLGHRDIKSTMVYLKAIRSKDAMAKVNAGELASFTSFVA